MIEAPLPEGPHDRVLTAVPEVCTTVAISHDLLGQPNVRHDGKAVVHEICRPVRKRADFFESAARRTLNEEFDDLFAYTKAPRAAADDERSYFGDVVAERGQFTATDHSIVLNRNEETMYVRRDFLEATRQEVSIFEILGYKRVDVCRSVGSGFANVNVRFEQR
jgi:uncharacterized protein YprB with RNaseH-like and TPR domain